MIASEKLNAKTQGCNVAKMTEETLVALRLRAFALYTFKNKATEISGDFSRDLRGNG